MKCSATEADQYYNQFRKYSADCNHPGADSATDSAIDMPPGDGSVSTINDIPPSQQHSPQYVDETPDYIKQLRNYRSRYPKPSKPDHPVIYEYQRPRGLNSDYSGSNGSTTPNGSAHNSFKPIQRPQQSSLKQSPYRQRKDPSETADAITV